MGHLETDANTFAEWGVDYIKIDGCYVDTHQMDAGIDTKTHKDKNTDVKRKTG